MEEEDVPPEVRRKIENQRELADSEEVLGEFDQRDVTHGEHMVTDTSTMRGLGSDSGMHSRKVMHEMSSRSGDKVSAKYAEFGSAREFRDFLDEYDLERCGSFTSRAHENADGQIHKKDEDFIWCNRNLVVTTDCDPLTGEGGDNCEVGYASSFNATGESRTLGHMYMQFHMQKGASPQFKDVYYYEDGEVSARDGGQM